MGIVAYCRCLLWVWRTLIARIVKAFLCRQGNELVNKINVQSHGEYAVWLAVQRLHCIFTHPEYVHDIVVNHMKGERCVFVWPKAWLHLLAPWFPFSLELSFALASSSKSLIRERTDILLTSFLTALYSYHTLTGSKTKELQHALVNVIPRYLSQLPGCTRMTTPTGTLGLHVRAHMRIKADCDNS